MIGSPDNFIFLLSLSLLPLLYLIFTYINQIEKAWLKKALEIILLLWCVSMLIIAYVIMVFNFDANFHNSRTYSDPKSGRKIIIYEKNEWFRPVSYDISVVKYSIFVDVSTHADPTPAKYEGGYNFKTLNPKIVWTKKAATVYMPDGNVKTVLLN